MLDRNWNKCDKISTSAYLWREALVAVWDPHFIETFIENIQGGPIVWVALVEHSRADKYLLENPVHAAKIQEMHCIWRRAGRCVPAGDAMERRELIACKLKERAPFAFRVQ